MTRPINLKEIGPMILLFLLFLSVSVSMPIYDNVNGFHNLMFDNYTLVWYDGRSPINFELVKNIIHNNAPSFTKGYLINGKPVEENFDLVCLDEVCVPCYQVLTTYLYATILRFVNFKDDLTLFKAIILLNILLSALLILLFYKIQRYLGLKMSFSFVSSLITGLATSILIYSRYLFINDLMFTLLFTLFAFFILKIWKKPTFKTDMILSLIVSLLLCSFLLTFHGRYITLLLCLFLFYLMLTYKSLKSRKLFLLSLLLLSSIVLLPFVQLYTDPSANVKNEQTPLWYNYSIIPLIGTFPNYIPALDYSVFGYHNMNSGIKENRYFTLSYSFEEKKGNAIFIFTSGIFGSMFGPKGFLYNSPFLIFSIIGISAYKRREKKYFILSIVLFFLVSLGLYFYWYGGYTPRYVRFFDVPILLLTFFSFYYLQELEKEKNKLKRYSIYILFSGLVILSILNVVSIAIRTDWNYEHEADLVSYDLVLWPWIEPKQTDDVTLYLTSLGETVEWDKLSETETCKSYGSMEGLVTYICDCENNYANYAERDIKLPWEKADVAVSACSKYSGGDGVIGKFLFGNFSDEFFIPSDGCVERSYSLTLDTNEKYRIALKPKNYGKCDNEEIEWKMITLKRSE